MKKVTWASTEKEQKGKKVTRALTQYMHMVKLIYNFHKKYSVSQVLNLYRSWWIRCTFCNISMDGTSWLWSPPGSRIRTFLSLWRFINQQTLCFDGSTLHWHRKWVSNVSIICIMDNLNTGLERVILAIFQKC